jgi:hypothetical protein
MIRAALAALFLSSPAIAEPACGPFQDMMAILAREYGEAPRFVGLDNRGMLTVLLIGPEATWTALHVDPTGKSCIVGAGENGVILDAPKPGDPA